MKKKILTIFISSFLVIVVSGCSQEEIIQNNNKQEIEVQQEYKQEIGEKYKDIDITNWKVYQNDKFGFKLKYPKGFIYKEEEGISYPDEELTPEIDYYKFGIFFESTATNECFPVYIDVKDLVDPNMNLDEIQTAKNELNGD